MSTSMAPSYLDGFSVLLLFSTTVADSCLLPLLPVLSVVVSFCCVCVRWHFCGFRVVLFAVIAPWLSCVSGGCHLLSEE